MGGSKLDANTYLKWITFKCKSTSIRLRSNESPKERILA